MMQLISILILLVGPFLVFGTLGIIKYFVHQRVRDIGFDLHYGGLTYILPLAVLFEEYFQICFLFFLICALSLTVTITTYIMDYFQKPFPKVLNRIGLKDWGITCLAVGFSNFLIGLVLSFTFTVIIGQP